MRGRTHCTIGVLTSIQLSLLLKIPISIFYIVVSAIFSLLPDLDESNSTISNFFLKRNLSKKIYKLLISIINFLIFFISLKINNNFILSSIITFISIYIVESKLTHKFLRKVFLSLIFLLLAFCLYLANFKIYIIIFSIILALFPWLKHRGVSHSLFAIIMLYILLKQIEIITNICYLSFYGTISYASHIFLGDIFTRQGVPIFYPINNKKVSLGNLRVGSFICNLVEILIVLVFIGLIFYSIIKI